MITFDNVYKSLGGHSVLNGMNMNIRRGETFVIVGPTGTGKSVSLRHMVGLHKADSGSVCVDGKDVGPMSSRELRGLRDRFGFLFQDGALLNWMNVRDNVALPLREKTDMTIDEIYVKVDKFLELLGLEDAGEKMPSDISGGMRKRAGLARAVIMEPDIILYDEPTSGLDPIMSRKIDKLIVSLKEKLNVTSVVVTHDMCSAFGIADRIAMLCGGNIVECGTPEEFKASSNDYVREFVSAQMETG